ncbi:endonuclease III [Synechococcus sp. CBW1107]|uniref:endonuclease III n=1 Tax=Synechococcus sp. CBW1107 TaxID=2789857 RepID=UPI002AD517C4|nr:endonuclease III [Synechococcus sp. CBW1107]CAK6699581.1 Endonuclease III [Synechococcus sp. CBW1107]
MSTPLVIPHDATSDPPGSPHRSPGPELQEHTSAAAAPTTSAGLAAAGRRSRFPTPRQRAPLLLERLGQLYPHATCSLDWRTPYELLVATMLSAQCTDERVNQVTPALFARFPDAAAAAAVEGEDVEPYVHATGFFRNKARNIVSSSRLLIERHAGEVPQTMEELLELPGVARKTATVVLAHAFGINAGVTVDTHVRRLSQRLGLSKQREPQRIEPDLMKLVPQPDWQNLSIRLIFHGRAVCTARNPLCQTCPIADLCPSHPERRLGRR